VLETLLDGLTFTEAPRWHDGRLWFSDFYTHRVLAVSPDGIVETILEIPQRPSGLGWMPDGALLVVSMLDRRLLRVENGTTRVHADLSAVATGPCNDMVVDARGRAYVGNFGYDRHKGEPPRTTCLARVDPDGRVTRAAEDLFFPNGTVITPDGLTLIVGESMAKRATAFTVADDGTLHDRRLWADLGEVLPDGCTLDAEGAIWFADARGTAVVRVREGGEVTDTVETGQHTFACALGGADGRTLFVVCADSFGGPEDVPPTGTIRTLRVDVPHAGLP